MLERDRVADRRAVDLLDAGDHEAHVARSPSSRIDTDFGVKRPSLSTWWLRPVDITRIFSPVLERAVHDAHQRDDADVVVEPGVDDQRLQRRVRIALGRRDALDERLRAAPARPRRSWR